MAILSVSTFYVFESWSFLDFFERGGMKNTLTKLNDKNQQFLLKGY